MSSGPPKLIAIDNDDYHAEHVGCLLDGRQFILTTPFEPAIGGKPGCEFAALYLFDEEGELLEARIESFGPRSTMNEDLRKSVYSTMLRDLGDVEFCRVEVAPFNVKRFDTEFGLIPRPPEEDDDDDVWAVEMQPGNYMAFFEPWDSGDYDT